MKNIITYLKSHKFLFMIFFCACLFILSAVPFTILNCNEQQSDINISTDSYDSYSPETTVLIVQETKLDEEPVLFENVIYIEPENESMAKEHIGLITSYIQAVEDACVIGSYTDNAISNMHAEIERLKEIEKKLQDDVDKMTRWKEEHYYAAETWMYLRSHGYNKAVAAGIIGNMMAETSGGSLNLNPEIYGGQYYGLCQWSLYYLPHMDGMSFDEQLDYLCNDLPDVFNVYGFLYEDGFNYEKFMKLEDPMAAAIAFAKVYERCDSGSYGLRKDYAMKAYGYFT